MNPSELPAGWQIDATLFNELPPHLDFRTFARVPQNPSRYAASILGEGIYDLHGQRFLTPTVTKRGRRRYRFNQGRNAKPVRLFYSRVTVALVYGPAPTAHAQAHHIDGNPSNDDWRNLRWHSPRQNRAVERRRRAKAPNSDSKRRLGASNGRAKLDPMSVRQFLAWASDDRAKGERPDWRWYANFFGVSPRQLQRIEAQKSWQQ